MDKTRLDHSCAAITTSSSSGNVVLVCGGEGYSDCKVYDPDTNSWTNGPSLPKTLMGSEMVTAAPNSNYDAFILGGYEGSWRGWNYKEDFSNKIYGVKGLTTVELVGSFEQGRMFHVALTTNLCK